MEQGPLSAADIAQRLAQKALSVCQHYLPAGRREGRYWQVGNIHGEPGRSLYVRLEAGGRGKAGNWVDAATGEHGDLLDLIRCNMGYSTLQEAKTEAQRFLRLPQPSNRHGSRPCRAKSDLEASVKIAKRLFSASVPLPGSLAARYLRSRGITRIEDLSSVRYHPRCPYRALQGDRRTTGFHYPAIICAVTDKDGIITGIHRTWLKACGTGKADVTAPRKSLGMIAGHGIRIGHCKGVLAIGEGLETMLSLREAFPALPVVAATSASHLSALLFPPGVQRIYVAREYDAAGDAAWVRLCARSDAQSIELVPLEPRRKDLNDDLMADGLKRFADRLLGQLHPDDRQRFVRV